MKLQIAAVGKVKEPWLREGLEMYAKRLSRFVDLKVVEVPDEPDDRSPAVAMQKEAAAVLAKLPEDARVLLCDLHGKEYDSPGFARMIQENSELSGGRLWLVIAGSNGFDESLRKRAQGTFRLSKLTFPHQLTRLILYEQLYRGFKILAGETYHK